MATFTCEDLHKKYTENQKEIHEKNMQTYIANIQEKVLLMNIQGLKSLRYPFYKYCSIGKNPDTIKEIVRRLQEIFIDSDIMFKETNEGYSDSQIMIDWSEGQSPSTTSFAGDKVT